MLVEAITASPDSGEACPRCDGTGLHRSIVLPPHHPCSLCSGTGLMSVAVTGGDVEDCCPTVPDRTECEHGGLKRKCRVCELEAENAELKWRVVELESHHAESLKLFQQFDCDWGCGCGRERHCSSGNLGPCRLHQLIDLKSKLAEAVDLLRRVPDVGEIYSQITAFVVENPEFTAENAAFVAENGGGRG